MITMYDTTDPGGAGIPAGAQAVAGYVGPAAPDNKFVSFDALVRRYPHAHHLGIAVQAHYDAECLDVETGDAVPSQAPAWVKRQIARGVHRPVVYANSSTMPAVRSALASAGLSRTSYRLWVAAYPGTGANVPLGFDAHQYTDHGPHGENYDVSICNPDFFGPPTPPPAPAKGVWRFAGTYDPQRNRFTIHGAPGQNVRMAAKATTAKFTGSVNLHTGAWSIRRAGVVAAVKALLGR